MATHIHTTYGDLDCGTVPLALVKHYDSTIVDSEAESLLDGIDPNGELEKNGVYEYVDFEGVTVKMKLVEVADEPV